MGKVFGISLSILLLAACCCFFISQKVFTSNTDFVELDDYPSREDIAADVSQLFNTSGPLFQPPLQTRGRNIIDSNDVRFKLVSINWYGASDELYIPGGLDVQHRQDIAATIRRLGFNSVRLPYADEMVRKNPVVAPGLLTANADLLGYRALDIYSAVIESLTEAGLAVIINNHITKARWCCDANPCDAIWANDFLGPLCSVRQTVDEWIENWETVMKPHIENPHVVGVDLRNEIRSPWGTGTMLWNAWANTAERAAERLLLMQPNWLVVVEGTFSANDISGARNRPINLTVPNKIVYSAHVYGWSGWGSLNPYWKREYESFASDMRKNWAYLLQENIAPVWIGELGAPEQPNEGDLHYWKNLMRYLGESDADFAYWAINPRKPKENEAETYSLIHDDWSTPKYDYRIFDMVNIARKVANGPLSSTTAQLILQS